MHAIVFVGDLPPVGIKKSARSGRMRCNEFHPLCGAGDLGDGGILSRGHDPRLPRQRKQRGTAVEVEVYTPHSEGSSDAGGGEQAKAERLGGCPSLTSMSRIYESGPLQFPGFRWQVPRAARAHPVLRITSE